MREITVRAALDQVGPVTAFVNEQLAALGVLLLHFRRKDRLVRFSWKDIDWREAGSVIARGLPMGISRISNTVRTVVLNQLLTALSAATAAGCIVAYTVHRQADTLLGPFIFGLADTVVTLRGIPSGEENRPMLKRLTKGWIRLTAAASLGLAAMNLKRKVIAEDFWDRFMALPPDFDVPEEGRIDRTISGMEEVVALSRDAWDFCESHGCDPKRTYAISLAVEELAANTVLTGFRPGHHNTIDMRIHKKRRRVYPARPGRLRALRPRPAAAAV